MRSDAYLVPEAPLKVPLVYKDFVLMGGGFWPTWSRELFAILNLFGSGSLIETFAHLIKEDRLTFSGCRIDAPADSARAIAG